MCFSAEADLVAGLVIGAVAVDGLRHTRTRAELPLAVLPLVLAGHQLVEAFVWWGLEGRVPAELGRAASWLYLLVAFGVLPVLVPVAVGALEPGPRRRRSAAFVGLGTVVAAVLVAAVSRGPVRAAIDGRHIAYRVDLGHGGLIVALYVVATCGSLLLATNRRVRWFGAVNLLVVCGLAWLDKQAVISLWCAWAAVTSITVAVHLRREPGSAQELLHA